jgi:DNA-directed RNA polymerase specialized sigma subunit
MSLAGKGRKFSDAHKQKIREATLRHHGISQETEDLVVDLYNKGVKRKNIVNECNVSRSYIDRLIKKRHLTPRIKVSHGNRSN